jgi:hypothetical protein
MDGRAIFGAKKQHVSCIAHIINLAVQALLGKGGLGASKPEDVKNLTDNENSSDCDDNEDGLVSFNIGDRPGTTSESDGFDSGEYNRSVKLTLNKLQTGLKNQVIHNVKYNKQRSFMFEFKKLTACHVNYSL